MDIRAAKVGGTIPSEKHTGKKSVRTSPEMDEKGEAGPVISLNDEEKSSMDIVINQYWELLKSNGISKEDVFNILDSIIVSGNVLWKFDLFEKIPVEFQMRKAWADDAIIEKIDSLLDEKMSKIRYSNIVAEYNLAASLKKYGDKTFHVDDEDSLDKSLKFVRSLPYIIQNLLVNKLAVFDRAVAVATSDWAIENFIKPRKDSQEPNS